ncbi:MAG: PAS domain S-box protein [Candidatus Acidiferrum sp.]
MTKPFSSNLGTKLRFASWPAALLGIVVIKAVLSLAVKPGSFLVSYSGISYFLLLLLATGFAIRNGTRQTLGGRPFWVLLAIAYGLWSLNQSLNLYYELGRHMDAPDNSIVDPVLFLHIVLLMAAVATFPHRNVFDRKPYRAILNTLLLLFFWGFLYGYFILPYQYLFSSSAISSSYGVRFDILYLLENLALVLAVGILTLRARPPWKSIYLHLLGASILYTLSSAVANLAIDSGGYLNGKLYGLGLTASVCWFVWVPLRAQQELELETTATRFDSGESSRGSIWAMLVVVMISIPFVWELFQRNESSGLRTLRVLVTMGAIVCLASAAYIKEYLARRELDFHFGLANDRLRLAMEASASAGWDFDVKSGRDVLFGDLQAIFGIASDPHVTTREAFFRYVHPDDRTRVSEAIADARQNRKLYEAEFRIVRPDGTVRWLAARGKFYYSTNGDPERMLGVSLDITDRKQAEDAVRETEKRYRRIVETTNEGVWLLDSKLQTAFVNRQMAEMLGYEPGEMVGRSVFDSYFPEDVEYKKQILEHRQQGVREQFEERLRQKDGSELWVRMAAIPFFKEDGEFEGALAMVSDITERKRAEEALRQSEARLRLAALAGKMYAYEWDVPTDMVVRSEEWMNVLGSKDEPKQLTRQQLLASVHPDDRALFVGLADQLTPDNPTSRISYRVLRPGGSPLWLEKNARAFFDEKGRMLRMIGMVADITERKRAEENLSLMNRRVIEAEERERNRIAKDLHEDVGQRLALLAIGIDQLKNDLPNRTIELLGRMDAVRKQTLEILNDVKASAHELYSPRLEYLGVAAVMRIFCEEFGERKKVEIDFRSRGLPSLVQPGVSICLFRVLQEALHNGIKHSGAEKFCVQLWSDDEIHLTVSDSGAGFDLEAARRGRGLGLIRMEQRLRLVNGTFSVDSQPEKGTTVHASVPLRSASVMRAAG